MFKRDYLIRQFDMLALVLSRVLHLLKEKKSDEALQAIDLEIERISGLDAYGLSHLTENELITGAGLGETPADGHAKRMALATLLAKAGEIYADQGDGETAYRCTLGALDLRMAIPPDGNGSDLPVELPTVTALVAALDNYALPPATHLRLFRYYEQTGHYAGAEDLLFDMLDAEPDSPELYQLGIAFYHRLLAQPDGALEAGNLPRQEVEAGLAELLGKRGLRGDER
jgi:hypothetical protein